MKHTVEKTRRAYNQWVADETLEDYALRYSPSGFRKWSPLLLANTALGGISFLALEAIGAVLLLNYGFSNAFWAILLASLIIFIAGFPISYYAARYNIDIPTHAKRRVWLCRLHCYLVNLRFFLFYLFCP